MGWCCYTIQFLSNLIPSLSNFIYPWKKYLFFLNRCIFLFASNNCVWCCLNADSIKIYKIRKPLATWSHFISYVLKKSFAKISFEDTTFQPELWKILSYSGSQQLQLLLNGDLQIGLTKSMLHLHLFPFKQIASFKCENVEIHFSYTSSKEWISKKFKSEFLNWKWD